MSGQDPVEVFRRKGPLMVPDRRRFIPNLNVPEINDMYVAQRVPSQGNPMCFAYGFDSSEMRRREEQLNAQLGPNACVRYTRPPDGADYRMLSEYHRSFQFQPPTAPSAPPQLGYYNTQSQQQQGLPSYSYSQQQQDPYYYGSRYPSVPLEQAARMQSPPYAGGGSRSPYPGRVPRQN